MEANRHAFHTTAHLADGKGFGRGLGGGMHTFLKADYGPNGTLVNTLQPFDVHVYFGNDDANSKLSFIEVCFTAELTLSSPKHAAFCTWTDLDRDASVALLRVVCVRRLAESCLRPSPC